MVDDLSGKAVTKERAKPTTITLGNGRQMISNCRWNDELVATFVIGKGNEKPITIGEIATFAHGDGSIRNKRNARRNVRPLVLELMKRGHLGLAIRPDIRKGVQFIKLYNHNSEQDRRDLDHLLNGMEQRKELLTEERELALKLASITAEAAE